MVSHQNLISDCEAERLRVLRRYEILDTPPDGAFDRITSIAARLFKVPIAIVSLVDNDRIWFKSHHGLDVQQIDRAPGLCASAVLSEEVYAITNASTDVRSLTNPLVVGDLGLRFYAAAPLRTHDGYNLGTLCVIDKHPRLISEEEKSILRDLAAIVMEEIELRLAARKVAQLNTELAKAKEAAEVANQAKSTFIANMSHELRSPLNAILGFSQLMLRSKSLSAENLENVGTIIRSGEHLLTLINQVLDFSKIEAGRTSVSEKNFDLYRLLEELEDMFQIRAEDKGLEFISSCASDVPRYIRTDEIKLRQVLINLLSNAIKFTSSGHILLRVSRGKKAWGSKCVENTLLDTCTGLEQESLGILCVEVTDGIGKEIPHTINFEVEDTGAGIAPDEIDKLFEAFVQTKTGRESQEGTGLGLAITRQFVQLMGGEISVSSEVGRGTTFKFSIAAQVVDATAIETKQPTRTVIALEPNQPCYRILIVDDKFINRQLLIKLLKPLGFELQEASNGKEAVELWESWEPHCIFMDMRMPVMDGYQATQRIKSSLKGHGTAIIALTASALEEEKAVILSVGCEDFIRKPFQESEIFAAIQKFLGVKYIYEENSGNYNDYLITTKELTADDWTKLSAEIATLPSDLVKNFYQATIDLDLKLMLTVIAQIRQYNHFLGETLADLAKNFQYQKILTLTQSMAGQQ